MKRIVILFNPSSGKKRVRKNLADIEAAFSKAGLQYKLTITESEEHLRSLAREYRDNAEIIIGAGGDTTMNIIAEEITANYTEAGNLPVLGMIGTGSANDVINSLNILSPADLCLAIVGNRFKNLDVCRLNINKGESLLHFIGSMSLGLGVVVNEYIEEFKKKHRIIASNDFTGQILPGIAGAFKGFRSGRLPQTAEVDGEEHKFSLMVLMNTALYANGLKLSDEVDPFDQTLDLMVINTKTVRETVKKMMKISKGEEVEDLLHIRDNRFNMTFPEPTAIQLDGDIYTEINTIEATVLPSILPVYVL